MRRLLNTRLLKVYHGWGLYLIVADRWQARFTSPLNGGRFGNGSRWFSGFHPYPDPADAEWD